MRVFEIEIEVQKKRIKNMHLHVKPGGRVFITAPMRMSNTAIEKFAADNITWIRNALKKCRAVPEQRDRLYVSGESISVWGTEYPLIFIDGMRSAFELRQDCAVLRMRESSSAEERIQFMREQYREILANRIERLLPKWERITGLKCREWRIKYMKTRWGTCNPEAKRIWLNLQLIRHPVECLEYIILHEITHLKIRNHGADFKAEMDRYMPNWRQIKDELNNRSFELEI